MNAVFTSIPTTGIGPRFASAIRASEPGGEDVEVIELSQPGPCLVLTPPELRPRREYQATHSANPHWVIREGVLFEAMFNFRERLVQHWTGRERRSVVQGDRRMSGPTRREIHRSSNISAKTPAFISSVFVSSPTLS